jgi:hypothetical protein
MNPTELMREIWQTGKERIKNPILGAFIISWVAIKHDLIIILFSNLKPNICKQGPPRCCL